MIKKLLLVILLITILLSGCKKDTTTETTEIIYATEYNHGSITINGEIYICGYQDNVCPNDFSPHKSVCKKTDPDCI